MSSPRHRAARAVVLGLCLSVAFAVACSSAPPPTQDQTLIAEKGCGACHTIPGVPGANGVIGPNLAGIASRNPIAGGSVPNSGPSDLKRWIMDPPAEKPGTPMPKLSLSDD